MFTHQILRYKIAKTAATLLLSMSIMVSGVLPAAWARDPATTDLSLKVAVLKAWNCSADLKAAQDNIDSSTQQKQDASDTLSHSFVPGVGANENPQADMVWTGYLSSDIQLQTNKVTYDQTKDNITLDIFTKYYNVVACQDTQNKAKADLGRDQQALQVARASVAVGVATNSTLFGAEAQEQASEQAVANAQNDADKAYISLNKVVGLLPEDRPVLVDSLSYTPLQIDNLDQEVGRAIDASKSLWMLQQQVALKQLTADYPWSSGGSYTSSQITSKNLDYAQQKVASTADTIRESVRNLYKDIRSIENKHDSLPASIKSAAEQLRVTRATYDVGMTTLDKIKSAEAVCTNLNNSMVELNYQHALQVANFDLLIGRPVVDVGTATGITAGTPNVIDTTTTTSTASTTPAQTKSVAKFAIGSTEYTLNGKPVTMDAVPLVQDGRALMPVRYVAQVLGVADTDIKWDASSNTVTIKKGNNTIQMTIGNKTMSVNSQPLSMDVAPQISAGRTVLPIRYLAQALGADIQWDGSGQTITVSR